jgi:phospholipid-binding lipoprotein MlaA
VLLIVLLAASAPATAAPDPPGAAAPSAGSDEISDPWQRYNRAIFRFNDGLSRHFAEPVARAWSWTVPDPVRRGMRNFFVNLAFPIRVVNTTLQAKPLATGQEIARFVVNVGWGLGGLFDPASFALGLPFHREDFGQTLGYWGVPPGPYFMLPFFGPSTVRDTFGLTADVATAAATFSLIGVSVPFFATFAAQAGNFVNSQSFIVDDVKRERKNAVDFYASVRNTYVRFRENQVADREYDEDPADVGEDLYYFDDEEDAGADSSDRTGAS